MSLIEILDFKKRVFQNRVLGDSFWAIIGNVIGKGFVLISSIIVARMLGKEISGELGIIRNTLMSIAIFSTFGLGYTATKFISEFRIEKPQYIPRILIISRKITLIVSGSLALILFLYSDFFSQEILNTPKLSNALKITAIWIIFNAITTFQIGVLSGFQAFKEMARINSIIGILTFILSVTMTFYLGFYGALIALVLSQIVNWYLNYNLIDKNFVNKKKLKKNESKFLTKEILSFSFPIALQEGLYSITSWVMSYILILYSDFGELGLYTVASQWVSIILFIPSALRNVILSHLSEKLKNEFIYNKIIIINLILNFILTFGPFLFIYTFSNFITLLYGDSFQGLENVINIMVFGSIFNSLSNVYIQVFMSKGKNWAMFFFRLFRDIIVIFFIIHFFSLFKNISGAIILTSSQLFFSFVSLLFMSIYYHLKLKGD